MMQTRKLSNLTIWDAHREFKDSFNLLGHGLQLLLAWEMPSFFGEIAPIDGMHVGHLDHSVG